MVLTIIKHKITKSTYMHYAILQSNKTKKCKKLYRYSAPGILNVQLLRFAFSLYIRLQKFDHSKA